MAQQRISRHIAPYILSSLENQPAVFVNGPRQAGKSTLVQHLAKTDYPADYITFDNLTQLSAATDNPEGFLRNRKNPVIIDEVQMVPALFRALKATIDQLRLDDKASSYGRFLLTGSANIMALPQLSDPLVGRMSVKTLYPLAACEAFGRRSFFLEQCFANDFTTASDITPSDYTLNDAIRAATFPEISGKSAIDRTEWFDGYLTTLMQRDVRMLVELEKITQLPLMLRVLAFRAGKLLNDADIARDVGLNPVTSKRYRSILQSMFLCVDIPPWYRNIGKRFIKAAKGYLLDTLLLCHLLEYQLESLQTHKPEIYGHVVENFVATELIKLLSFSDIRANLFHFRTNDNKEIDFILERPDGSLVAIEIKSTDQVTANHFKYIKQLQEMVTDSLACGIVLHNGTELVSFGDKLHAVPISFLWR